jgi:hypothetical protein
VLSILESSEHPELILDDKKAELDNIKITLESGAAVETESRNHSE